MGAYQPPSDRRLQRTFAASLGEDSGGLVLLLIGELAGYLPGKSLQGVGRQLPDAGLVRLDCGFVVIRLRDIVRRTSFALVITLVLGVSVSV